MSISRLSYGWLMGLVMGQPQLFDFWTLWCTCEYSRFPPSLLLIRGSCISHSTVNQGIHGMASDQNTLDTGLALELDGKPGVFGTESSPWQLMLSGNRSTCFFRAHSHGRIQTRDAPGSRVWPWGPFPTHVWSQFQGILWKLNSVTQESK